MICSMVPSSCAAARKLDVYQVTRQCRYDSDRGRTTVRLSVVLAKGTSRTVEATRTDPYVAVSDAFRSVRQQLLAASPGQLVA